MYILMHVHVHIRSLYIDIFMFYLVKPSCYLDNKLEINLLLIVTLFVNILCFIVWWDVTEKMSKNNPLFHN